MAHQAVGYDNGKKIKGRKHFTLVDMLGLLITVRIVVANVAEREGAKLTARNASPRALSGFSTGSHLR